VSDDFMLWHVQLKSQISRIPLNISWSDQGMPSVGFIAVMAALHLCETVDLYGFEMCTRRANSVQGRYSEQLIRLETSSMGIDDESRAFLKEEQDSNKVYCRYFGTASDLSHPSDHDQHMFAVEHMVLHKLETCGTLRVWR